MQRLSTAAANGWSGKAPDSEKDTQAVRTLLQRPWFRRIWVRDQITNVIDLRY